MFILSPYQIARIKRSAEKINDIFCRSVVHFAEVFACERGCMRRQDDVVKLGERRIRAWLVVKNIGTHTKKLENGEEALAINVLFALQSGQAALEEFCESFTNREGVISVEKHHFKNPVGE